MFTLLREKDGLFLRNKNGNREREDITARKIFTELKNKHFEIII